MLRRINRVNPDWIFWIATVIFSAMAPLARVVTGEKWVGRALVFACVGIMLLSLFLRRRETMALFPALSLSAFGITLGGSLGFAFLGIWPTTVKWAVIALVTGVLYFFELRSVRLFTEQELTAPIDTIFDKLAARYGVPDMEALGKHLNTLPEDEQKAVQAEIMASLAELRAENDKFDLILRRRMWTAAGLFLCGCAVMIIAYLKYR